MGAYDRFKLIADEDTFEETETDLISTNPSRLFTLFSKNRAPSSQDRTQRCCGHWQNEGRR
jgi:hypothetical protein